MYVKKVWFRVINLAKKIRKKINNNKRNRILVKIGAGTMFIVGLYLVSFPIWPRFMFFLFHEGKQVYPYETKLEESEGDKDGSKFTGGDIPKENRLVIPAIDVDMPIVEGTNDTVLDLGVWHRPGTGTPGYGNMVLTGHRVGYAFLPEDIRNSTSFYNLDKLQIDDYVIIYWQEKEYDYQIYDFEIIDKMETSIESQEGEERLTLYTCHPIGQNAERLVYYAKPLNSDL